MAIIVGSNISLKAKMPLDTRQQFNTIAEMKAFPESSLSEGIETFNLETKKKYSFLSTNPVDATLGKWREVSSNIELTQAEYDELVTNNKIDPSTTYFITDGVERSTFSTFSKVTLWEGVQNTTGTIHLSDDVRNYDELYVTARFYNSTQKNNETFVIETDEIDMSDTGHAFVMAVSSRMIAFNFSSGYDKLVVTTINKADAPDPAITKIVGKRSVKTPSDYLIPIGFVYTQLPNQLAPWELWQEVEESKWENISSQYAGDFFRVEGGNANEFESGRQNEELPNISGSLSNSGVNGLGVFNGSSGAITLGGGASINSDSGDWTSGFYRDAYFNASNSNSIYKNNAHVTPFNQTVRVWKRKG